MPAWTCGDSPCNCRQELRQRRLEEAYGGWQERRPTQEEAARLLGEVSAYVHARGIWLANDSGRPARRSGTTAPRHFVYHWPGRPRIDVGTSFRRCVRVSRPGDAAFHLRPAPHPGLRRPARRAVIASRPRGRSCFVPALGEPEGRMTKRGTGPAGPHLPWRRWRLGICCEAGHRWCASPTGAPSSRKPITFWRCPPVMRPAPFHVSASRSSRTPPPGSRRERRHRRRGTSRMAEHRISLSRASSLYRWSPGSSLPSLLVPAAPLPGRDAPRWNRRHHPAPSGDATPRDT